jgi:hypothetical protein
LGMASLLDTTERLPRDCNGLIGEINRDSLPFPQTELDEDRGIAKRDRAGWARWWVVKLILSPAWIIKHAF